MDAVPPRECPVTMVLYPKLCNSRAFSSINFLAFLPLYGSKSKNIRVLLIISLTNFFNRSVPLIAIYYFLLVSSTNNTISSFPALYLLKKQLKLNKFLENI